MIMIPVLALVSPVRLEERALSPYSSVVIMIPLLVVLSPLRSEARALSLYIHIS